MKITGTYTIDAPQDQVWEALNDMEVLARIVPGCERLEQTGDNEFEGTVKIGIQTIKGTYSGRIRLEDIQPPNHYKLVASGRSANGVVDGSGTVDLSEQDGKTVLKYGGDAQIGGVLASVGQRLIEGASKQMINQSLKALVEQINARANGSKVDDTPTSTAAPEPAAEPAAPEPAADATPVTEAEPAPEASVAPSAPAQ
ncbi:MAG TPA: carbon monoxide dehydrogenase subunit G, partial [Roseiflexaceae bacterium]|nr:carbon monoxide dehydrogenase subunit G [Roseiflexaceae bacterium]